MEANCHPVLLLQQPNPINFCCLLEAEIVREEEFYYSNVQERNLNFKRHWKTFLSQLQEIQFQIISILEPLLWKDVLVRDTISLSVFLKAVKIQWDQWTYLVMCGHNWGLCHQSSSFCSQRNTSYLVFTAGTNQQPAAGMQELTQDLLTTFCKAKA